MKTAFKKLEGIWFALGRPYPFKFLKGCIPQILLGPFLNTLSHMYFQLLPCVQWLFLNLTEEVVLRSFSGMALLKNFAKFTGKQHFRTLLFNPFWPSLAFPIETCHLICNTNQMIGFYVNSITGLKWGNKVPGASANDFFKTRTQS